MRHRRYLEQVARETYQEHPLQSRNRSFAMLARRFAAKRLWLSAVCLLAFLLVGLGDGPRFPAAAEERRESPPPRELAGFFQPPEKYRSDLGPYRSPLRFADGTAVKDA